MNKSLVDKTKKLEKKNDLILSAEKIYKVFKIGSGMVEILKGVDLKVYAGEFIILFGSSGCGKSTFLNILLGLEIPSSGKIIFMDEDIYKYDEDRRSQIRKEKVGLIYQQQNWVKSMNVLENVALPLTLSGFLQKEREEMAYDLIKKVGMENFANQVPTELSSGQQQRVSLARALISDPVLLVADEPTGNLDSESSIKLLELFKAYNEGGNTIVMVTHDLEFLIYATKCLNMSDGLIVAEYKKGDRDLDKFKLGRKK